MPDDPRPRVTWVFGATLDGRVAAPDGTSRWISSQAAREDAHRLRAAHDAVLVGSGAARIDDPHLGLRHGVDGAPPLRVVLDARASIVTSSSRVADDGGPDARGHRSGGARSRPPGARRRGARPARRPRPVRALRPPRRRWRRAACARSSSKAGRRSRPRSWRPGLVDDVVGYVRAAVLGAGRPLLELSGVETIGDLRPFRLVDATVVGDDVRIRATIDRA